MMRYSALTHCFYPSDLDYADLPADLIDVPMADFTAAMSRPIGATFSFVDGTLVITAAPPFVPAIPASVSPAQARLALLGAGKLAQVEAIVAAADPATRIAWQSATVIERSSPTVAALSAALGLDGAQLDALFTTAAAIRV